MASSKFNKIQVAKQAAFGTAIGADAMKVNLPLRGTYEDKRQNHIAEYDAGTWTPTQIVTTVAYETAMKLEGTAFYEILPVLLTSGLSDEAPSDTYLHTFTVSPTAIGTPMPLTALVGTVGTNIGGTGPAVRLRDLYLKTLKLSSNINDKAVMLSAEFFGTTYDDNSKAGYVFDAAGMTTLTPEVINGLGGVLRYQDAAATGGDFATMTDFECTLLDWEWMLDTGIEPAWCLTDETTTWAALKYTQPSCEFKPILRTSATTYAAVKGKADDRTFQELELYIHGTGSLYLQMTGLWDVVPSVHEDQDGEVVMKPTFICRTPYTQTTTPHFLTIKNTSTHNWAKST